MWRLQRLELLEHLPSRVGHETRAHLARKAQRLSFVVPDQQRVDASVPGSVASDDELLLRFEFELHPIAGALARDVERIALLGDDAFEAELFNASNDIRSRPGQFLR